MEKILYKQKLNKNAKCNIWCAYPACYSFAMSSLGYLWIFKSIDDDEQEPENQGTIQTTEEGNKFLRDLLGDPPENPFGDPSL